MNQSQRELDKSYLKKLSYAPLPRLAVSKIEATQKLKKQIVEGQKLKELRVKSPDEFDIAVTKWSRWSNLNTGLLRHLFSNSSIAEEYSEIVRERNLRGLLDFLKLVDDCVAYLEFCAEKLTLGLTPKKILSSHAIRKKNSQTIRNIFIVHGHDEAVKESVARLIGKMELQPIILHEQPNAGRTIIEKFEDYSNVAFAVILLTPDDVGASQGKSGDLKPRARQNVILELGYFLGKLGRGRVCALYKEGVEIPSDYQGVLYIPMDAAGAWRMALAKEIKNAGIEIDLNKL